MDTKEFDALGLTACRAMDVSPGTHCLVLLISNDDGTFTSVKDGKAFILSDHNRVCILDDPPVLAKDLPHGTIFKSPYDDLKRCRVLGHTEEDDKKIFAPPIQPTSLSGWFGAKEPCIIVKDVKGVDDEANR